MIAKGYIYSILYVSIIVLLAEVLYKIGVPKKYTRKVVHVLAGLEWVILYRFFGGGIHTFVICLFFLLLLTLEYRMKLLPMMSSESENAPGTVYYAAAMTAVSFVCIFNGELMLPFGIAVMATSFGDGFAGIVGQALGRHSPVIWGRKTLFGSLADFLATFSVIFIFSHIFELPLTPLACLILSVFATELELFASRGFDNIAVTVGTFLYTVLLMYHSNPQNFILPIIFTPIIIAVVLRRRALTLPGTLAALVLDIAASVAFGNVGFLILILYFIGSILSDKYKNTKKCKHEFANIDKTRTIWQVLANGIVPFTFSVLYLFTENILFFLAFAASLSESLADTVASGIGSSAKRVYDPFRMKRITPGNSGGISSVGTFSAILIAIALSLLILLFEGVTLQDVIWVSFAAVFGVFVDTALGSLLQARYRCRVCSLTVEEPHHCNTRAEHIFGVRGLSNSAVNLVSSIASALFLLFIKII